MRITAIIGVCIIQLLNFIVYGQTPYSYKKPPALPGHWQTSDLQSQHSDTSLIYKLFEKLKKEDHKINSILLVKNGKLSIEEYFGMYSAEKQHDLRSVTKSITSILMGIALDKGCIGSVDDPVYIYFKGTELEKEFDAEKKKITIRHLLTMSTGLDCNDWDKKSKGQEDKLYKKKNMLAYFLDLSLINEPGSVSNYCTGAQILAMEVISRACMMPVDKFAEQYLFTPLNISNFSWGHTSRNEIVPSAKRLYMTPRDMAKIGQLILNKGEWEGQQLVSREWIRESTSVKTAITGIDYGFLWWNFPFELNGKKIVSTLATGNGGQYIFVFPEEEMVVVFTGDAYNSAQDKFPFKIIREIFLPAFTFAEQK